MAKPSVVVYEKPGDQPEHWRGFAAGLCFIYFYFQFVHSAWWVLVIPRPGWRMYYQHETWARELFLALSALSAFLLGRNLWFNGRKGRCCLWCLLGLSFVVLAAYADYLNWVRIEALPGTRGSSYGLKTAVQPFHPGVPWVLILPMVLWQTLRRDSSRRNATLWARMACAWMVGSIAMETLVEYGLAHHLTRYFERIQVPVRASLILGALGVVAAAGVLTGRRWAYWIPLAIGMFIAIDSIQSAFMLGQLVRSSVQSMLIACPQPVQGFEPWPYYAVLNGDTFSILFVWGIGHAGPWFLIAWYARKVPMRTPVDDGSPYPRRYCGKCLFNLHGVEADRCPECGNQLAPAPT